MKGLIAATLGLISVLTVAGMTPGFTQVQPPPAGFDDHQNMMDQLGVKALRPGPDPNNQSTFDEATANPYKDSMPDVLRMKDGTKVIKASQWPRRRAEIVEDFEREVYGRIPKNVPKVTWEVTATTPGDSGGVPILTRTLVGHVDNSAYPQIAVNIQASFTTPAAAMGSWNTATPSGWMPTGVSWPSCSPGRCTGCWARRTWARPATT